ncbi:LTA synthase family protein [Pseudoalteromonas sp. G4]|uniref:LTA synthase family protein n=1 Tax=Pseudoalteromonas sp. G4 TaxID=2992761 RepID=UPI00237E89FB|nr:LTA synthase family protein [Pseudoalteromonas sp. G4]MDE3270421.1 LTA synthase family protein [Pseudoalteromonas sp. G4]
MLKPFKLYFAPYLLFSLVVLILLSISRLCLSLWQFQHFTDFKALLTVAIGGFRIDLSTVGYVLIIPSVFTPILSAFRPLKSSWFWLLKIYLVSALALLTLLEIATPTFIEEYGLRPNRLFIEYLIYPKEVFSMLVSGHLNTLIISTCCLVVFILFVFVPLSNAFVKQLQLQKTHTKSSLFAAVLLPVLLILMARGTLGHRPINPAYVYFSNDALVNSLTLNSTYSVVHAIKALKNEKNAAKMYGNMSDEEVISLVQTKTGLSKDAFVHQNQPTRAIRAPSYTGKKKNLVIILEESLGAQYVQTLGGLPLTPNIDGFYREGWGFEQLYATGTRSVRGIEAVITGFTPTPARAVVKLDKSQKGFFTIASLLQSQGYTTQFIYGGESHFDNMKSFFLGNGFSNIVDFKDIESPNFIGSWGASDGDLFTQADKELAKLNQSEKPFFSLIFSSSNHDPFEIPQGVVSPINYSEEQRMELDENELKRHLAIQYADYALGQFIATAKARDYWQDTVFLIVADHDARALGKDLVPINNFHIPAVILNTEHNQTRFSDIASQIDLAPTLLSLVGAVNDSPMLGRDLTVNTFEGRALMQYANNFAYLTQHGVTVLQPSKAPSKFLYDVTSKKMQPVALDEEEAKTALAHALWGSLAYQNGWYTSQ